MRASFLEFRQETVRSYLRQPPPPPKPPLFPKPPPLPPQLPLRFRLSLPPQPLPFQPPQLELEAAGLLAGCQESVLLLNFSAPLEEL